MPVSEPFPSPEEFSKILFEKMAQVNPGIADLELYEFRYCLNNLCPRGGWASVQLAERKEIENTSFGRCFAFPHARTDLVKEMLVAIGISRKGIKAPTPDGRPLHVVCLLLTTRNIAQLYLQTLSGLAQLARDEQILGKLIGAPNAEALVRVIWETGLTIRKQLTVRDLMHRDVVTVSPDDSLKDVANKLYRYKVSGMPVVWIFSPLDTTGSFPARRSCSRAIRHSCSPTPP